MLSSAITHETNTLRSQENVPLEGPRSPSRLRQLRQLRADRYGRTRSKDWLADCSSAENILRARDVLTCAVDNDQEVIRLQSRFAPKDTVLAMWSLRISATGQHCRDRSCARVRIRSNARPALASDRDRGKAGVDVGAFVIGRCVGAPLVITSLRVDFR